MSNDVAMTVALAALVFAINVGLGNGVVLASIATVIAVAFYLLLVVFHD